MKVIVVLGPQGSGKGTISSLLVERFGFKYFDMGAQLREEIKKKTKIGIEIEQYMKTGKLFPDEFINNYFYSKIKEWNLAKEDVLIIDGYPRTFGQKEFLDKTFGTDIVLFFNIPEEVSIFRLSGRRYCPKCGRIYNINTEPKPKEDELCDICKVKLKQREDDMPEAIKTRLEDYKKKTYPILEKYREQGKLIEIDAKPPIKEVFEATLKVLKQQNLI